MEKKSHRKRFSRKRFSNIMISNSSKELLDSLKPIVAHKLDAVWHVSYAEVITFVLERLDSSVSYPVKEFSISYPIKKPQLSLSFPVKKNSIVVRSKIKSVTIN